jgi:hypothetical protein
VIVTEQKHQLCMTLPLTSSHHFMDSNSYFFLFHNGRQGLRRSPESSASTVTRLRAGRPGFDSRKRQEFFLFATVSRPAHTRWVPRVQSSEVMRPGCEADHSPPSSTEVKNEWSYTSTPHYAFLTWYLLKHRVNFSFTLVTLMASVCQLSHVMTLKSIDGFSPIFV